MPVKFIQDTLLAVEEAKAGQLLNISSLHNGDQHSSDTDLRASNQKVAYTKQEGAGPCRTRDRCESGHRRGKERGLGGCLSPHVQDPSRKSYSPTCMRRTR